MDLHFCDDLLDTYSDAELVSYIRQSPQLAPLVFITVLSDTLLAKYYYTKSALQDASRAMDVARQLGIRTPCIRRIVNFQNGAYCIMNRINGVTLETAWATLSWHTTIALALQLRRFIHLLQSITSSTAGSLDTGECRSFWLEDRFGLPTASIPETIQYFIQFWADFTTLRKAIEKANSGTNQPKAKIPAISKTLVFTHHDLAPRNLIVSPSRELYLLDWDHAGFYPKYFEYASMQNFQIPSDWGIITRWRWNFFVIVCVGWYPQEASILERIRSKFTRYPVGRRFELLKNGGPSRRPAS